MFEVIEKHRSQIKDSRVLAQTDVAPGEYFLATLHRAENVDSPARLQRLFTALSQVADHFASPMVVSVHPRTRDRMRSMDTGSISSRVRLVEPFGFFDFVQLESSAKCVLTDSGTVQEECCILRVPNVTVRDVTERAETLEAGSTILTGSEPGRILDAVGLALHTDREWPVPVEYLRPNVSSVVVRIVCNYEHSIDGSRNC